VRRTHLLLSATAVCAAISGVAATVLGNQPQEPSLPPPIPAAPHDHAIGLGWAQRFDLEVPYTHGWRRERPPVQSGWLLVLSVNPDLVVRREIREPVLYVGAQTAERINAGDLSGRVVAVVPGDFLLEDTPIFFGSPALPEEVDAAHIDREVRAAVDAGRRASSIDDVVRALAYPLHLRDQYELRMAAIDLVERFSPQERGLIESSRLPRLR
jgi:hypothetical protein